MNTHAPNQLRCHPFRIDQGFIGRHIQMQVLLVNTSESTQVGTKCRTRSLAGVAMHFASAIAIIIPRPFVYTMADGAMPRMATTIALPLIGIEFCAARRNVLHDQSGAGARVGMVADPPALLSRVARDDTDDGRAIVRIGAVPFALVGAPPGGSVGSG